MKAREGLESTAKADSGSVERAIAFVTDIY